MSPAHLQQSFGTIAPAAVSILHMLRAQAPYAQMTNQSVASLVAVTWDSLKEMPDTNKVYGSGVLPPCEVATVRRAGSNCTPSFVRIIADSAGVDFVVRGLRIVGEKKWALL